MYTFGHYLLKKPINALWVIVLCTFVPLMGLLASIILGLVTLRKSTKESALALAVLILANIGYSYWLYHLGDVVLAYLSFIGSALAGGVFLWAIALLLRRGRGWTVILILTFIVAIPVLLVIRLYTAELGAIVTQWLEEALVRSLQLSEGLLQFRSQVDVTKLGMAFYQKFFVPELASYFVGSAIVAFLYISGVGQLILSRWWEAHLYPGAVPLGKELLHIRMPALLSLVFVICSVLLYMLQTPVLFGVLPILLTAWLIASLSLIHGLFYKRKANWLFITLIYISLFVFNDYVLPALLLAACVDSIVDFRKRFSLLDKK